MPSLPLSSAALSSSWLGAPLRAAAAALTTLALIASCSGTTPSDAAPTLEGPQLDAGSWPPLAEPSLEPSDQELAAEAQAQTTRGAISPSPPAAPSCPAETECLGYGAGSGACAPAPLPLGTPCSGGAGRCDGQGQCAVEGLAVLGESCAADGECAEGHCSDGICCESACDGLCEQCGSDGRCDEPRASDSRCPAVACPVDNVCRDYPERIPAGQCVGFGQCQDAAQCATLAVIKRAGAECACDERGDCGLTDGARCTDDSQCGSRACEPSVEGESICCEARCGAGTVCSADGRRCIECEGDTLSCQGASALACQAGQLRSQLCANGCVDGQGCSQQAPIGAGCEQSECADGAVCAIDISGSPRCCARDCAAEGRVCLPSGACGCPPGQIARGEQCLSEIGDSCSVDSDCAGGNCVDRVCCTEACDGACEQCQPGSGFCGAAPVGSQDEYCGGTDECGVLRGLCVSTLAEVGEFCSSDGDCEASQCVDGVCCAEACDGVCEQCQPSTGQCVAVLSGLRDDTCSGTNACSGLRGLCVSTLGDLGDSCRGDTDCDSGQCVDGVCCAEACDGACEQCQPGSGFCVAAPRGSADASCGADAACTGLRGACESTLTEQGDSCRRDSECATGSCVDGVCCAEACNGSCEQCAAGSGLCVALPAGLQDSTCRGDSACTGSRRSCRSTQTSLGGACSANQDCQSGRCVDGVCCAEACDGICERCARGSGRCEAVPAGLQDASCGFDSVCTGRRGQCRSTLAELGASCAANRDCQSGRCVDGVCCAEACNGVCEQCQPRSGLCRAVEEGRRDFTCSGTNVCTGRRGVCESTLTEHGGACRFNSECQSGRCIDGVCCRTACGGSCEACAAGTGRCEATPGEFCSVGVCGATRGQCFPIEHFPRR